MAAGSCCLRRRAELWRGVSERETRGVFPPHGGRALRHPPPWCGRGGVVPSTPPPTPSRLGLRRGATPAPRVAWAALRGAALPSAPAGRMVFLGAGAALERESLLSRRCRVGLMSLHVLGAARGIAAESLKPPERRVLAGVRLPLSPSRGGCGRGGPQAPAPLLRARSWGLRFSLSPPPALLFFFFF